MPMRSTALLATSLLGAALVSTAWCGDDEVKLKQEEVPAVVLAALEKAANGKALSEFEQEQKHRKTVYTAEFTAADGKKMEITVAQDGTVLTVEAEGDEKDEKDGKDGKDGKDDKK
jgi:hypothetical protein